MYLKFESYFPDPPVYPASALEVVDVLEGQSVIVNLTATANPPAVTYTWFKEGELITGGPATRRRRAVALPHFLVKDGVLTATNVTRADRAMYTMKGENGEGVHNFTFNLNVQCELFLNLVV